LHGSTSCQVKKEEINRYKAPSFGTIHNHFIAFLNEAITRSLAGTMLDLTTRPSSSKRHTPATATSHAIHNRICRIVESGRQKVLTMLAAGEYALAEEPFQFV
jgi:hypothetical protein